MNPDQFNFLTPSQVNPTSNLISQRLAAMEQNVGSPTIMSSPNTDSVNSAISKAQQILNSENNSQPAKATKSGGLLGDLESALPTIGGIGGSLIGSIGDIAGPLGLATTAGGAALGAGLGQALENKLQGKSAIQSNDLTSAAENAAGVGVGSVIGRVLGKAGGALTRFGAQKAEQAATDKAAQEASQNAINEAAATKDAYADVPKGLRQQYNAQAQTNYVKGIGLDPNNPQNLIDTATAANDIYNSNLGEVLAKSGPVDLSGYNQMVKDVIAGKSSTLGSFDKVAIGKGRLGFANTPAAKLLQQLEQEGMGTASTNADANDARELLQRIQTMAADAKPTVAATTGAIDPTQKATYDVLNEIANGLKKSIYSRPEVKEGIQNLVGNIQASDVGGNQALADNINEVLNNAKDPQDILSEMSNFTNMSKLGKAAQVAQQDIASPASLARVKAENEVAEQPASEGGIRDLLKNPVSKVADLGGLFELLKGHPAGILPALAIHAAENPEMAQGLGKAVSKVADTKIPQVLAQIGANVPNIAASGASQGGGVTNPVANDLTTPYTSALSQALSSLEYAQRTPFMPGAGSAMTADTSEIGLLVPLLQKLEVAQNAIGAAANQYNIAGGGRGGLTGLAASLLSHIPGTQQNAYRKAAQSAQTALTGITGTPINLPSLLSGQNTAQDVLNNISAQLLGSVPQPS